MRYTGRKMHHKQQHRSLGRPANSKKVSIPKKNKTFRGENCNFTNPKLMNGDAVIDPVAKIANNRNRRSTNLTLASSKGKQLMMEIQRGDDSDPENTKFQ
uniref:Ovule protein n=1 Tax=Loa loa TaxID=7209 RepID=A0A1I7VXL0_LOALO